MAFAKKCDICGFLYEGYNEKDSEKNPNGFMFVNLDSIGKYYAHNAKDCCPNCMKSILAYIKTLKGEKTND